MQQIVIIITQYMLQQSLALKTSTETTGIRVDITFLFPFSYLYIHNASWPDSYPHFGGVPRVLHGGSVAAGVCAAGDGGGAGERAG